jgi:hypothetical protein
MKGDEYRVFRNSAGADDFAILCRSLAPFRRIQRGGSARLLLRQGQKAQISGLLKRPTPWTARNFVLFSTMQFGRAQGRASLGQGL